MTTSGDTGGLYYPSAKFMAEQVGCLDTFHAPRMPGTSESAGECDLPIGAHIEFRTFTTEASRSPGLTERVGNQVGWRKQVRAVSAETGPSS